MSPKGLPLDFVRKRLLLRSGDVRKLAVCWIAYPQADGPSVAGLISAGPALGPRLPSK